MRKIIFAIFIAFCVQSIEAKIVVRQNDTLATLYIQMNDRQTRLEAEVNKSSERIKSLSEDVQSLRQEDAALRTALDSVKGENRRLNAVQTADRETANKKIGDTNMAVKQNGDLLENRTLWGGIITLFILAVMAVVAYLLSKRIRTGSSSIDEVRKAQDSLQAAQTKMQEESVRLDSKLIEIIEKQLSVSIAAKADEKAVDHSLALKVADEIVRTELNLSRMDASVKGYRQLLKAVQRIKDNFMANGYEIVDMLGKPYVHGMKAAVTFVTDESLEPGQQIITKIIKPQINFRQEMIQAAEIEVSQSE